MQIKRKSPGRAAVAVVIVFAAFSATAEAATLAEAQSAYRSNRVAEAERMFAEVAADPAASESDRAGALRELARIDWLIRGETDAAARALSAQSHDGRCETLAVALRVFREARAPKPALDEAARERGECATTTAAEELRVAIARAHLAQAQLAPEEAARHLAAATAELGAIDAAAQRTPDVAAARLSLSLAEGDAAAALHAWRSYFWLDETDAPTGMPEFAGRVAEAFSAGLARDASESDRASLVDLLIRAGFAEEAALLATGREGSVWRRARAYLTFWSALEAAALEANRAMATGGEAGDFAAAIGVLTSNLMRDAGLAGDQRAAFAEAFGLYGTDPGTTGGYPSLHLGHLVQDDRMQVEQYGRRGEVRFVVLDNMLANGFVSWLWDGREQVGGWSSGGDLIVQVRPAYTSGPLNDLRRARPGPARDRFLADIERKAVDERAALERNEIAELPATADRLRLEALDQIAARNGGDDDALMAEIWRAINQSSIEAHEGRHALDNAEEPGLTDGPELEYRAKLSQIAFADYPRLGLASVAAGAHDETQHGVANRRVLKDYRRWIRKHAEEITGYDRRAPALSQLHLLTDEQIVAAARSMDPWARKRGGG